MRILIIPHLSKVDAMGDSSLIQYRSVIKGLSKFGKCWFYVLIPKVRGANEVIDMDNASIHYANRHMWQFFEEGVISDPEVYYLFNSRSGMYPIDVVLNSKVSISPQIYRMLMDFRTTKYSDNYSMPLFNVVDREFGRVDTHSIIDDIEFSMRALSYSSFDTWFMTDFEKEIAYESYIKYLPHYLIDRLKSNSRVVSIVPSLDEIDEYMSGVEKNKKFTIFWGGRLSGQKRLGVILETYKRVFESGIDVDIVITSPIGRTGKRLTENRKCFKECSAIKYYPDCPREEFIKKLAASHLWMSASMNEGLSFAHIEMAYSSVVGIVPDRPWSRFIFGDDYPFMYRVGKDEVEEAYSLIKYIYENYDKCKEIGIRTRESIRKRFSEGVVYKDMYNMLMSRVCRKTIMTKRSVDTLVQALKKFEGSEFTLYDLLHEYKQMNEAKFGFFNPISSFGSPRDVYNESLKLGAEDKYDAEVPVMTLREVRV